MNTACKYRPWKTRRAKGTGRAAICGTGCQSHCLHSSNECLALLWVYGSVHLCAFASSLSKSGTLPALPRTKNPKCQIPPAETLNQWILATVWNCYVMRLRQVLSNPYLTPELLNPKPLTVQTVPGTPLASGFEPRQRAAKAHRKIRCGHGLKQPPLRKVPGRW